MFYIHIFVDLVKRSVLTFVGDIPRCTNDRIYLYYYYHYVYIFYFLGLMYTFPLASVSKQIPGWLNLFNAELSPKRYWREPRSQEVGEEGDYDT